ncbi:signal peptidase I [Streptomyces sp. NPDC092296]|uniref:signal peptidase I n=1 Tax=Streptomyces sp. NPDC092296 TaxID=3366012 RepID=UPI003820CF99
MAEQLRSAAPEEEGGTAAVQAEPKRRQRPLWKELPLLIALAIILALGIKTFFVQAFSIPSGSMENTLQVNDRVLVDKLTPWFGAKPERGEVVVFHDPGDWLQGEATPHTNAIQKVLSTVGLMPSADEKDLIKRVIAVGGDTVTCRVGSPVAVNGVPLDEPYLYPGATPCDNDPVGSVTVPKGKIWVMGDHRNNSEDSRFHQNDNPGDGFVPVGNVVGRAFVVAWPVSHWATLPVPATFHQQQLADGRTSTVAAAAAPGLVGLTGAAPLTLWYRRRRGQRLQAADLRERV